jgi:hypothetical protein
MKNYLALLFIPAAFVYSCKKTNSVVADAPASIVGTWYVTNDSLKEYDSSGLISATNNTYNKGQSFQFNANGSGFSVIDTIPGRLTFTYTVAGSNAVLNYPAQNYNNMSPGATIDSARIGLLTQTRLELIYKGYFFGTAGSSYYYETEVYLIKPILLE